jgi:prolyl 4-hydroxylase
VPHHVIAVSAKLEQFTRYVDVSHLRDSPSVRLLRNFITDEEAAAALEVARPLFKQSPTISTYRTTVRNSSTAMLPRETVISQRITTLAAHFANVPKSHVESLQVLHYGLGQMYEPHLDVLDSCDLSNRFYGQSLHRAAH